MYHPQRTIIRPTTERSPGTFSDVHSMASRVVYNIKYEGWNFNSGNYLFTTDTK